MAAAGQRRSFHVGAWLVEPAIDEISQAGRREKLEPRAMQVLLVLAARPGEVVTIDELLDQVWVGVVVTPGSVYKTVAQLRKILGDISDDPAYIVTIPRKGYRLIATVSRAASTEKMGAPVVAQVTGESSSPDYGAHVEGWPDNVSPHVAGLQIVRPLARGTRGPVFLARETALDRPVTVKVLDVAAAGDSVQRKRFERESLAAARIVDRHVAAVYRVGELPNGLPFMVGEFVEGHTLAARLDNSEPFAVDEACKVLVELATALRAADAKRVIHRDLRPANVVIERGTGRVVLTDFGTAGLQASGERALERLTRVGELLGDPRYASPEQIRGEPLTAATDVYSLGVMGYEMLTGSGPFGLLPVHEVARAHLDVQPQDLAALRSDVPVPMAKALRQCLTKQPAQRPSAAALVGLLAMPARAPLPAAAFNPHAREGSSFAGSAWLVAGMVIVVAMLAAWQFLKDQ